MRNRLAADRARRNAQAARALRNGTPSNSSSDETDNSLHDDDVVIHALEPAPRINYGVLPDVLNVVDNGNVGIGAPALENDDVEPLNENIPNDALADDDVAAAEDLQELRKRALKNCFLKEKLNYTQVKGVLKTLRAYPFSLVDLPQDSRTILNTLTLVVSNLICHIAGGEYLHLGFTDEVLKKLWLVPQDQLPENIVIDFSTDSGQLYREGYVQFWPI